VTSITNFGAFVDLGGADGLIHVSELSWGRVDNPRQVLKVGDEVDVYVLDVDRERKRIALSLKKLQPDPWTIVDDHYRVGELVEGRVTRVLDFGAFVELDLGIEGLLHSSEMIGTPELPPSDIVHPGEKLLVKIIRIESRRRRLALSARQVRKSEWERWIAEQQTAHEAEEAKAREEAARVREAEALEQAAPVQETEASISEQVEVEREAESATEAEAIAPEEEAPVGKVVEEAAPASEPEMEEAIPSETEKVAPDEGTDVDSGIQAPEVADGAQAAD
jgi:small subunit ribosomal protein S1